MWNVKQFSKIQSGVLRLAPLWLIVLGLLAYGSMFSEVGFVEDDFEQIWWPQQHGSLTWMIWSLDFRHKTHYYRPVSDIFFAITSPLFGLNANGYHAFSLVIHLCTGWLVNKLITKVTTDRIIGLIAGGLFVLYPVAAKAIFWIASINELLAVFFSLIALLAWLKFMDGNRIPWAVGSLLAGGTALLSKEIAVTLPLLLLSAEALLFATRRPRSRAHWAAWGAWGTVWIGYLFAQTIVSNQNAYAKAHYALGEHIVAHFFKYISYLIWPFVTPEEVTVLSGALLIGVLITFVSIATYRGQRWPLWLLFFLCVAIAPVLPFIWAVRGRYLYLAAVPWSGLLAGGVVWSIRYLPARWSRYVIGSILAIIGLMLALADIDRRMDEFAAITDIRQGFLADVADAQPTAPQSGQLTFLEPPLRDGGLQAAIQLLYGDASLIIQNQSAFPPLGGPLFYASEGHWRQAVPTKGDMTIIRPVNCCDTISLTRKTNSSVDSGVPRFQNGLQLSGYSISDTKLRPGMTLLLLLDWQAVEKPTTDETVFTHLVDEAWQQWGKIDRPLLSREQPTSRWSLGESTSDYYLIHIDPNTPPSKSYFLVVGLYTSSSTQSIELVGDGSSGLADQLVIGPFEMIPKD